MSLPISLLTSVEGSNLEMMFKDYKKHNLPKDRQGFIFLDKDPIFFRRVIDFIRSKGNKDLVNFNDPFD